MNRTKRYVASEMVSNASVDLVRAQHQIWRATSIFEEGLTPKEKELLRKKHKELGDIQELLSQVEHRLRQSGRCT